MNNNGLHSTEIKEHEKINFIVDRIVDHIYKENQKNKIPLIITGSGISSENVPNMSEIMDKICSLVEFNKENLSKTFNGLLQEYENNKDDYNNSYIFQSRLLSYIQFAYLEDQRNTVEKQDVKILTKVWNDFIKWLLDGGKTHKGKEYTGLSKVETTNIHKNIVEMYKSMNAVSITTNFDNLLSRAFEDDEDSNFVPILTDVDFNNFYLNSPIESNENAKQMAEIQSRGDVFWSRCSGKRNSICPHTRTRCYIPARDISYDSENHMLCSICKSPIDVYFAFPATKEKDTEMAKVFSMVWKYLALRFSTIIVLGSSMKFDPVLMNFMLELSKRKEIAILYISNSKSKKEITERLFYKDNDNRWWIHGSKGYEGNVSEDLLSEINKKYKEREIEEKEFAKEKEYTEEKKSKQKLNMRYNVNDYINYASLGIGRKNHNDFISANKDEIFEFSELLHLKRYSQLGLKTKWLSNSNGSIENHNRYKHSVNTLIIASALYLSIKKENSKYEELKFVQVAALLHDLGHLPFSHLIEEIFEEFGWIPYGERKTFNHEYNTKEKIQRLFNDESSPVKKYLNDTNYTSEDLIRLIKGEFGVGYLDAIINSPIDADKIEYLFTDSDFIGLKSIDFKSFLEDYTSDIYCNENQFMVMCGKSTSRMLDLIRLRADMYNQIYLRPGLRYLESCCKLIIRTFFTHMLCENEFVKFSKTEINKDESQNLSTIKIKYVIQWIEKTINNRPVSNLNEVCEIYLINKMMDELKENSFISSDIKAALNYCHRIISETNSNKKVNEIENKYIIPIIIPKDKIETTKIQELIKTVNLRFPGILLLDYVESKAAFSFSESGKPIKRMDKTYQSCENIIIRDINVDYNSARNNSSYCFGDATKIIAEKLYIETNAFLYIYKICEESYKYFIAKDYVLNELRELGLDVASSIN